MRTFKWPNEDETFQVDDSTGGGKDTCSDLLTNGAVEVKASKTESPSMAWKINAIREWMSDNDVDYDRGDSKKELLARL
jgi:hypothetical protein